MRPTPEELANGIRALLREIAPEITSSRGLRYLRRVMATLRDVRWNEAGFDLLAENAALARMLHEFRPELLAGVLTEGLATEIERLLGNRDAPASFEEANERNRALRFHICRGLERLRQEDLVKSAEYRRFMTERLLERFPVILDNSRTS